jgi:hypothetical protein
MVLGEGKLWVLRTRPNELVRIEPGTLAITRRTPLPATPSEHDVIAVAAGQGRVWVRFTGEVVELTAQ